MRSVRWRNLFGILVGAAIMGFGINAFNLANDLAEGGVTGIAILLKLAFNWDPGFVTLAINIPLFFIGAKVLGRSSLFHTIFGTVAVSCFLWLFGSFRFPVDDKLLASLFAGIGVGAGLGIIFRYGGTTGGIDIIARIINKRFGWTMGRTMFAADVVVLLISLVHLSLQQVMYTAVAVFVGARLIDFVQEAAYAARAVLVVSESGREISKDIMGQLGRGVTIL
ncbi:MAG: YitT family protein, partial [Polyangiaceae bacterium]|nr:YitT family protein [Polyangiaceae bacterium]